MVKIGFNLLKPGLAVYSLSGLMIGLGIGIILSNVLELSQTIGWVIFITSSIISVYIWHKKGVKQIFMK